MDLLYVLLDKPSTINASDVISHSIKMAKLAKPQS